MKKNNFLVIGLGSMGKRRIRNLIFHKINKANIFGFDLSLDRCREVETEYKIKTFNNFKKAEQKVKPDVYIISTPPHLHKQYFLHAAKKQKHFFVEVATTNDGYSELIKLLKLNKNKFIAAPSVTFRYFKPVIKIKKIIESGKIGQPQVFCHHLGQYLPDWHPWEDYRQFYVSKKQSSACKEMLPFELQWISWVFNTKFTKAKGLTSKVSDLEINIDDVYAAVIKSQNIIGTMMIDLIAQPAVRVFRVLGSKGTLEWDWQAHRIKIQTKNKTQIIKLKQGKKIKGYQTTTEEMYNAEIKDFLDAIAGKIKYPYTFREDEHNFKLLAQIEKK